MPAPDNVNSFLELGYRSGLLEKPPVEAYCADLIKQGAMPESPQQLADVFIRGGLLTNFQAEKLLGGRWRGFVISGKYRLLDRLGAGGMGSVYLCEHIHMGRRVALKVLPIAQASDPASLARFYREARAVARLDHPHIVRAHDIDRDDQLHFMVLEFVDGCNLHDFVKKNGILSPNRAAHFIRQAARGLQHAHEAGLVHRDIKPGNLLLERTGIVKLLDMGLARFFDDDGSSFAKEFEHGFVIGTADYLAPEQVDDSRVDIRADIYSLGATFYYLLVAKSPFQDGTIGQKMIWHKVRQPKPVCCFRQDVPTEMLEVLHKMMAKEPSCRYQTPSEIIDALEPWTRIPIPPPTPEEMPPFVSTGIVKPSSHASNPTAPHTPGTVTEPPASSTSKVNIGSPIRLRR